MAGVGSYSTLVLLFRRAPGLGPPVPARLDGREAGASARVAGPLSPVNWTDRPCLAFSTRQYANEVTSVGADLGQLDLLDNGESRKPVISVAGLTKRYGDLEAVRGIDFEVMRGETFGFLGPNGAGKTTTIKILCTLAKASSGSATVAGHDTSTEQDKVRRMIGLVFQDTTLDNYLTAQQNLRFHAALYAVPPADAVEQSGCARSWAWWGSGNERTAWSAHFRGV